MRRPAFLLLLLALISGCGTPDKAVAVSGTVLKDGKPFTFAAEGLPPGDPGFRLGFVTLGGGDKPGDASYARFSPTDGTFQVSGPKGKGLPPGKYRITVQKG